MEKPAKSLCSRRDFLKHNAACAGGILLYHVVPAQALSPSSPPQEELSPSRLLGALKTDDAASPIGQAHWYTAEKTGDGLEYTIRKGALQQAGYLVADMLLDGQDLAVFSLTLKEGPDGPAFSVRYGLLTQCSARMRLPLSLVDMNRWRIDREGAWLKPQCSGSRVNLANVDRFSLTVLRKSHRPVRWCMTPVTVTVSEPQKLDEPTLTRGPLLDAMGQCALRSWDGKSRSVEEVTERLRSQLEAAPSRQWPERFSRWGGWKDKRFSATGFFRKEFDGNRWWLVDPDGFAFWSAGLDCVRPGIDADIRGLHSALSFKPDPQGPFAEIYTRDMARIDYLKANFIRAFDPQTWKEKWDTIAMAELRRLGFNTVGNWSDWEVASRARFPYVRPLSFRPTRTGNIYRDFPDVFDPAFQEDVADYARQLAATADDPALIGYFMMNEPTWGFSSELPAVGMLLNSPSSHTRKALAEFLRQRYPGSAEWAAAWNVWGTFEHVADGPWKQPLNKTAENDLEAFSEVMVERFFKPLADACKRVDAVHMNLGIRYQHVPPSWSIKGMTTFDVFSMNWYGDKIPAADIKEVHDKLKMPIVIGEFHFGALDAGLPASGIGHVRTQADRGRAYRIYTEDAAANPYCVGVHWFTLYDQSAVGRFDGENYNIGFLDVCNRPYVPLCEAARLSHEAIYEIAAGKQAPFADAPEHLPKLFL